MASLLYIFLLLSRMKCALHRTEHVFKDFELHNALKFINNLRDCSIASDYSLFTLPMMDLFKPTSVPVVNHIMKNAYVAYWQHLRQHHDCSRLMTWLVKRSKGAALSLDRPVGKTSQLRGIAEAALLEPIFKGDYMSHLYSECHVIKHVDTIKCLKTVIVNYVHDLVKREMILTALYFLDIAANIPASNRDLKALRSVDIQALGCIRDWDRINTIPRILYLSLFLHARNIISHLMNNQEESNQVSKLEALFDQILNNEFPSNMIKEIRREQIVAGGTAFCAGDTKHTVRAVKEIRLLLVKQSLKDEHYQTLFLDDNSVLYVSLNEGCYRNDHLEYEIALDLIKQDVMNGNLNLPTNPIAYELKYKDE